MSPSASDVSVIVVNWNGRSHLQELLPSLAALSCGEIILVDNGSIDGSQEFVRHTFPSVRVIENPTNYGFAQPCNQGAAQARKDIVAFINNDMRADPDWLRAALARLSPQTPCVASRILNWSGDRIDFNGSSLQYLGFALQKDIGSVVESVSHQDHLLFPCGGAMLIEKSVFLSLDGFDSDFFAIFEDVDLGWRLWLAGFKVAYAEDSVVYHRGHATFERAQSQKTRYLMHRNAMLTICKNYEEETFQRLFPLALLQAIDRAIRLSGVRRESFYLWSETNQRLQEHDQTALDSLLDGLNHLVAVDDILRSWPAVLAKRRRVQLLRKRSDAEIIGMFGDPLRAIVDDPEYVTQEIEFLRLFALDALFDPSGYEARGSGEVDILQDRIKALRTELQALQWLNQEARLRPLLATRPTAWNRFLRIYKREGIRSAWKSFVKHVDHGI